MTLTHVYRRGKQLTIWDDPRNSAIACRAIAALIGAWPQFLSTEGLSTGIDS